MSILYAYHPVNGQPLKSCTVAAFVADTGVAHTTATATTDSQGKFSFTDLDPTKSYKFDVRYGRGVLALFLPVRPMCRVYNDATISHAVSGTPQVVTFNTERYDTDTMHSTVSNTGRITFTTAGVYHIVGTVEFAANATGSRSLFIRLNGSTNVGAANDAVSSGTQVTRLQVVAEYNFAAADYVELVANQDSGGALNLVAVANYSPEFWASLVSNS